MGELDEVLAALEASLVVGASRVALATIISARGSTYRREGARLVVPEEGDPVGNISGGCLEGDVVQTARQVLATGQPQVLSFDLTADDEAVWGWGLGCNGVIEVLVEPADLASQCAAALRLARQEQRPVALVTVVEGAHLGARMIVRPDGASEGWLGDAGLDRSAVDSALDALARGRSGTVTLDPGVRTFVEVLEPPVHLIVCGAGHDVIPLVDFGARLGWRVDVVDDRSAFLTPERFPGAQRLVTATPGQAAEATGADQRSHVVVMSHNFLRDKDYLRSFLASPAAYLGMLGPKARLERILEELDRDGEAVKPDDGDRLYGPAGLDIGAEGPEEIAWAIVAEILAYRRHAGGGNLSERNGPIHRRTAIAATR